MSCYIIFCNNCITYSIYLLLCYASICYIQYKWQDHRMLGAVDHIIVYINLYHSYELLSSSLVNLFFIVTVTGYHLISDVKVVSAITFCSRYWPS